MNFGRLSAVIDSAPDLYIIYYKTRTSVHQKLNMVKNKMK